MDTDALLPPDAAGGLDTNVPVDATDPIVLLVAWVVNWGLYKVLGPKAEAYQYAVPTIAVLLAVGLRAGIDAAQGHALDSSTLLRAFASGAGAVLVHAQTRQGQKWNEARKEAKQAAQTETPPGPPPGGSTEKTPTPVADPAGPE